jgi:2-polyprenyl-3-methyl-5-hydroxy-6-metoxy-1,4-benzoquinol methylase
MTGNMCVLRDTEYSLKTIFSIADKEVLIKIFDSFFKKKLYEASSTFFTRKEGEDNRHMLRNRYIYSTFDLEYVQVGDVMGQRRTKRRLTQFRVAKEDIQGRDILDIGSNIGGMLFEVVQGQPARALGLEYDSSKVLISNRISALHGMHNILRFENVDVESEVFTKTFNQSFDTVFCLALIDHLKGKEAFFRKLGTLCHGVLFFEGNGTTSEEFIASQLRASGFTQVEYLGLSDDEDNTSNNCRPLFRAIKSQSQPAIAPEGSAVIMH